MNQYVLINETLEEKGAARIAINDLSILRGYGIFDFFKTIRNKPVWLEDHLDRLYASAFAMHMAIPFERAQLKERIFQLMEKNKLPDSGIRITLTGGYSEDGYTLHQPNLLITQEPFNYNPAIFEKGTRLVTFEHQRQLPSIKTIDYLQAIRLQPFLKERNAQDILYCFQNEVLESPRANFFIVNAHDEIITPARNILNGITRKRLLALTGFNIKESIISPAELAEAKEAFITSTTRIILPVLNINGKDIGNGQPGKITRQTWHRLRQEQVQG